MTRTPPPPDCGLAAVQALVLYALAEHQGGHAGTLHVTAEGERIGIADDGRGHALDKQLEGTPYLRFVYTHFDYPFGGDAAAPVQLQGIGMSLVNVLCRELVLSVRKPQETLHQRFEAGRPASAERVPGANASTGISVQARLRPDLPRQGDSTAALEAWLRGLLRVHPALKLFLNGRPLHEA